MSARFEVSSVLPRGGGRESSAANRGPTRSSESDFDLSVAQTQATTMAKLRNSWAVFDFLEHRYRTKFRSVTVHADEFIV